MQIQEYELGNLEKLSRATNGSMSRGGKLVGGLAALIQKQKIKPLHEAQKDKEDLAAYEAALLAEYDRLGGLITKDGNNIKTGGFWNLELKIPREVPVIVFLIDIDNEVLEVTEVEAVALRSAKEKVAKLKKKRRKKKSKE